MSKQLLSPTAFHFEMPPTEDELPYDDGIPLESQRHRLQMNLLIEPIELAWARRDDFFVNGNMFVYFSPTQTMDYDFRGQISLLCWVCPSGNVKAGSSGKKAKGQM